MDFFNIDIDTRTFLREIDKLEKDVKSNLVNSINDCAEDLLNKSQALTPLLTGDLQSSGNLTKATKDNLEAKVGYNSKYALYQHEKPYSNKVYKAYYRGRYVGTVVGGRGVFTRSKPSIDGMEAGRKYLERPVKKYKDKYLEHISSNLLK